MQVIFCSPYIFAHPNITEPAQAPWAGFVIWAYILWIICKLLADIVGARVGT